MIASVHLADVGPLRAAALLTRRPRPATVPGLRHADVALAAPLRGNGVPLPHPGRVALLGWWDDEDALDRFLATSRYGRALADGWQARLEPLRAHGAWPGLPPETTTERHVDHEGPAVVTTLGRLRLPQAVRFLRTSGPAERRAANAPGMVWGTALALPPFVATVSLWEDSKSLSLYAYGRKDPAHPDAIDEDQARPFHHRSAFVRFRPLAVTGHLEGRNPLPMDALARLGA